jgi:hypothetical protein
VKRALKNDKKMKRLTWWTKKYKWWQPPKKKKFKFKICKSSGMRTQVKAKHIHTSENTWKNKKYISNKKLWERCENNKNKTCLKEGNRKFTSWGLEI